MSKVYENAIFVLRAMEELNLHLGRPNASEARIQAFVGLKDAEFDPVMVYLHQNGFVSGAGNKAEGSCWLTAGGIDVLENALRSRVDMSLEAERLLRFIVSAEPPQGYHNVRGTSFADVKDSMGIDLSEYNRLVVELHDLSFIESAVRNASHITAWDVRPTPKGRTAVRSGFQLTQGVDTDPSSTLNPVLPVQTGTPSEISDSLAKFRGDHPEPERTAFIMMRFRETEQHDEITVAIRNTLRQAGIDGLRADDRHYHDDQWWNVATYLHGCEFGIAVFEQIEETDFNPNVALEVGYMMALRKPICLLKERHVKHLHSDLLGRLYQQFDAFRIRDSIPPALAKWLQDRILDTHGGE